jgi:hypothetical protein
MTYGKVMVRCIGQMEAYTKDNGNKAYNKDKV